MVEFTNRRVTASVGRTIKVGADFEYTRFNEGMEGDIADNVDRKEAHDQLFKELLEEVVLREATVKATHNSNTIDKVVDLLRSIFQQKDAEQEVTNI